MKKLCIIFAHPDDESFVTGGTIAKYASLGWRIDLVCATAGEGGQFGPVKDSDNLSEVRQKELETAASILGISSVLFLDCKDGKLADLPPGELEDMLHKQYIALQPDVVITFEPKGISNHPDHCKLSISATFAFQKYAKTVVKGEAYGKRDPRRSLPEFQVDQSRPEPKLYYAGIPQRVVSHLQEQGVLPSESFGKPWVGIPDDMITTVIDIQKNRRKKAEAIASHVSQEADAMRFLQIPDHELLNNEYYVLRMQGVEEVFMGKHDAITTEL